MKITINRYILYSTICIAFVFCSLTFAVANSNVKNNDVIEKRVEDLLSKMTLEEKIGQMNQFSEEAYTDFEARIKAGEVGSILNEINPETINKYQRAAVEQSRLGIPILFARDIIHGFKTIFPISLGQAASWNPALVEECSRITAVEATSIGLRWTFAPMIDVTREPRWGRIAESSGEDPYLGAQMGAAVVKGFQGKDLSSPTSLIACAKHFAGYGATEGGRDYNTTVISQEQLRNTYLIPFKAASDAGCATFMTAFTEMNGIPSTVNSFLTKRVLRDEWKYDGMVVSDWSAITEMLVHGFSKDTCEAALKALKAGIDMDMMGMAYRTCLYKSVESGLISESLIDNAVRNILRLKFRAGLFEHPYVDLSKPSPLYAETHLKKAQELATQSCVLLKNENNTLPLNVEKLKKITVIGPLANAPHDQMGTWVFDGEKQHTVTPLQTMKDQYGDKINYINTLTYSRDKNTQGFKNAVSQAKKSDVILFFGGEESILSGEARCRADISLPGVQSELLAELKKAGKPIVMIVMAGRPVELYKELNQVDALLYAWHPGTMGGPAIVDLLFGQAVPSGKLPLSFPKLVGQIPIYYNHKNTGRPAVGDLEDIDEIPAEAPQMSLGNRSYYLDAGDKPLFPFGFGLSYTTFKYDNLILSKNTIGKSDSLFVTCTVTNTGKVAGDEVVQLYIRDLVASVTRPVRELKDFSKIHLSPGESKQVSFTLSPDKLSFWNNNNEFLLESGQFKVWIAPDSAHGLEGDFSVE